MLKKIVAGFAVAFADEAAETTNVFDDDVLPDTVEDAGEEERPLLFEVALEVYEELEMDFCTDGAKLFCDDDFCHESGRVRRFAGGARAACGGRLFDSKELLVVDSAPPIASLLAHPSSMALLKASDIPLFLAVGARLGSGSFLTGLVENSRLTDASPDMGCLDVWLIVYCDASRLLGRGDTTWVEK